MEIPERVSIEVINDLCHELGLDPQDVFTIDITPVEIRVVLAHRNEHGSIHASDNQKGVAAVVRKFQLDRDTVVPPLILGDPWADPHAAAPARPDDIIA